MPVCACKQHHTFSKETTFKIYKCSSKKHKRKSVEKLRSNGLLPPYAKYVCTACVAYCESNLLSHEPNEEPPTKKCRTDINVHVASVIEKLKNGTIYKDECELLASALGSYIKNDIFHNSISVNQLYQDEQYLKSFYVGEYFYNRNSVLTSFISSVAGVEESDASKKKMLLLCHSLDCLYKARNLSLITPLSFSHNLISYCLSGSKTLCSMNSLSAGGGYTAIRNWLKRKSASALQCPEDVDVITYFDNNQVIGRNWRVIYNYKSKCSVITTVLHIIPSCATQLQKSPQLSPFRWLYRPMDSFVICKKISDFISNNIMECEKLRNQFIADRITSVMYAQKQSNDVISDEIDNCDNDITIKDKNYATNYSFADSHHPQHPPKTILGDPIFCNPCSYNSIHNVFQEIQSRSLNPYGRKWTPIGCDGLPYVLGSRLIEEDPNLQSILLLPGLGHYEINMLRCVFKILWNVVIEDLSKMLGFKTVRALSSCFNCSDHHKSWQIFIILLFGTMDEILVPYVRHSVSTKSLTSVSGFFDFLESAIDPNYIFLSDIVFNYLVPLFIFRCGVRKNNHKFIMAGRCKFSELFYCTNMYFYQEIDFRDLKTHILAPEEVSTFLKSNQSFSVSGFCHKGEGGDFVLEAWNRRIKRLLPPGLPQDDDWLRVCRNLENLEEIRQKMEDALSLKKAASENQKDLTNEIIQWRVKLRTEGYLSTPFKEKEHRSLSGQELDRECVMMSHHAKKNRQDYLNEISVGHKPGKGKKLQPIFVVPGDRHKYYALERKTKDQLHDMIMQGINEIRNLGQISMANTLMRQLETAVKKGTKKEYLFFYREVTCALEDATAPEEDEDEDEDD